MKNDIDAKIHSMVTAGTIEANRAALVKTLAEAKIGALMTHQFK